MKRAVMINKNGIPTLCRKMGYDSFDLDAAMQRGATVVSAVPFGNRLLVVIDDTNSEHDFVIASSRRIG